MSESRMDGGDLPTPVDVEAMRAWTELGACGPPGDERVRRTYSDGRIFLQAPSAGAAREIEEVARAHEQRHGEHQEALRIAVRETLARGVAVGPGPWAPNNPATEKGRDNLRRAGFEERHDGEGTVWVRPADDTTLKPREAHFVVPVEPGLRGGGSQ